MSERKSPAETTLPIRDLFEQEALELVSSREKAKLIHGMRNIRSAGDEVEDAVRDFFRRRLPRRCEVGNGHIVDITGRVSPDIDLIIADTVDFPALQESRDKRLYFPFESVYAVAEIKSTYYKADKPVTKFIGTLKKLRLGMHRNKTSVDFVASKFGTGIILPGLLPGPPDPLIRPRSYLNPLFSFMVFVDSGDFSWDDLASDFSDTPLDCLPNIICFLDKGILAYHVDPSLTPDHYHVIPFPEFGSTAKSVWALAPQSRAENLALLWACLTDVLCETVLQKPHYLLYVMNVFEKNEQRLQVLTD